MTSELEATDKALHLHVAEIADEIRSSGDLLARKEATTRLIACLDGISLRDKIIRSQTEQLAQLRAELASSKKTGTPSQFGDPSIDNMLRYYAAKIPYPLSSLLNFSARLSRWGINKLRGLR